LPIDSELRILEPLISRKVALGQEIGRIVSDVGNLRWMRKQITSAAEQLAEKWRKYLRGWSPRSFENVKQAGKQGLFNAALKRW